LDCTWFERTAGAADVVLVTWFFAAQLVIVQHTAFKSAIVMCGWTLQASWDSIQFWSNPTSTSCMTLHHVPACLPACLPTRQRLATSAPFTAAQNMIKLQSKGLRTLE
jgi:hypothetical protein